MVGLNGKMTYFSYFAKFEKNDDYNPDIEKIMIYFMIATVVVSILLLLIQSILVWKENINKAINRIMVSMRLKGA